MTPQRKGRTSRHDHLTAEELVQRENNIRLLPPRERKLLNLGELLREVLKEKNYERREESV